LLSASSVRGSRARVNWYLHLFSIKLLQ
jgi:hypothetical protein